MEKILVRFQEIFLFFVNAIEMTGPLSGIILIVLEAFLPFLPIWLFITVNVKYFGPILGFIFSWLATTIGCILVFLCVRKIFESKVEPLLNKKTTKEYINNIDRIKNKITNINFSNLVILIAMPFIPSFIINIAAGVSQIKLKKFILALLTGKIFTIYFWTYIGTSLIESMLDLNTFIKLSLLIIVAYILSKIIDKLFNK